MSRYAGMLLMLIGLDGCASERHIEVAARHEAQAVYENGSPILTSMKQFQVVARVLTPTFGNDLTEWPTIYVGVTNTTDQVLEFSDHNVEASSGTRKIRVLNEKEMRRLIRNEEIGLAIAAGFRAGSKSFAAASHQAAFNPPVLGSSPYVHTGVPADIVPYTPPPTYHNPVETQASIQAQQQVELNAIAAVRRARIQGLNGMLDRNTVGPGLEAGGLIRLKAGDLRSGEPLVIRVRVGEEVHEFEYTVH